jgi:hypothetical protein
MAICWTYTKVKLGTTKRIKCAGIFFPLLGSLCTAAKPCGEGHRGGTLFCITEELHPIGWNPESWQLPCLWYLSEPTFASQGIIPFAHKSLFPIFLLFMVLLLQLGQCPNLGCWTQEPRNIWNAPITSNSGTSWREDVKVQNHAHYGPQSQEKKEGASVPQFALRSHLQWPKNLLLGSSS